MSGDVGSHDAVRGVEAASDDAHADALAGRATVADVIRADGTDARTDASGPGVRSTARSTFSDRWSSAARAGSRACPAFAPPNAGTTPARTTNRTTHAVASIRGIRRG
ncbi:hypothetical protein ACFQJD_06275 [Haloplanus sp. GCM10025708]|uniref:hypothetical protein n=1 Tax=Haloplanus sp. GCM10025708 TaxID=3252679 RepID=UPI00362108E8